jgi:hypothetical protein
VQSVHWPTDVLVAACIGTATGWLGTKGEREGGERELFPVVSL